MASSEVDQLPSGAFHAILDEIKIVNNFKLQRRAIGNEFS